MTASKINYNLENNKDIIDCLKTGDEDCFDTIFRYYYKALCSYASQYVIIEKAEGIVQDTMMWLWENRKTLIPSMSLKGLLFTIVKNKAINEVSHQKISSRVHERIAEKYMEKFSNPDFYLENELLQIFEDAINKLPDNLREVFVLNRMDGLTHKEIAVTLGVSPQTVNYRICQTMKILRKDLKDYLPILLFLLS